MVKAGAEDELGGAGAALEDFGDGEADEGLVAGFSGGKDEAGGEAECLEAVGFLGPGGEDGGDLGVAEAAEFGVRRSVFFAFGLGEGEGGLEEEVGVRTV